MAARKKGPDLRPLDEVKREHILRVLEHVGGKKTAAAKILGVGRRTLYRLGPKGARRDG